ncbi:MAG: type II toxin-antitoxin system PemK/MazF family toxin [Dethiobacteria bacterium]|jgi:mRNA interferase MazF
MKDYSIIFTNSDMAEGHIKVDSCIRADKIYTFSKAIAIRKFGTVKARVIEKVKEKIASWINDK